MEDQKKKFLLGRIQREERLITSEYQKLKRQFISRALTKETSHHYLEQVVHIVTLNNTLAANLFEYLDRAQTAAVFQRFDTVFNDLICKFREIQTQCRLLESGNVGGDFRQICDVCHDKMEFNRLQNIRKILYDPQESAAAVNRVLDQQQKERKAPVFNEQEDRLFRDQLEKVMQTKQLTLHSKTDQSSVFLQTVTAEITDFMLSFRQEFAEWEGGKKGEAQEEKWGGMMKDYVTKKLANSFSDKIPSWFKKMHNSFANYQPARQKVYSVCRGVQTTGCLSVRQDQLLKEVEESANKLIIKREALKMAQEELKVERNKNKELKSEIERLQGSCQEKCPKINEENCYIIKHTAASHRKINNRSTRNSKASLLDSHEDKSKQIGKFPFSPQFKNRNSYKEQAGLEQSQTKIGKTEQVDIRLNGVSLSDDIVVLKDIPNSLNNSISVSGEKGELPKFKKRLYNIEDRQGLCDREDDVQVSASTVSVQPNNISCDKFIGKLGSSLQGKKNNKKKTSSISLLKNELIQQTIKRFIQNVSTQEGEAVKQKDTAGALDQQNKQNCIKQTHHKDNLDSCLVPKTNNSFARNNKSLHTVRKSIQDRPKLPNIAVHKATVNANVAAQRLGKDTIVLFIDEKIAFKYEQSFIHSHHMNQIVKPNPSQLQKLESLFATLQTIKCNNSAIYKQICSFIRYPFTSIKEDMVIIDIISELAFPSFCNYFFKILWLHKQCLIKESRPFCHHIQSFIGKMKNLASPYVKGLDSAKEEKRARPSLQKANLQKIDE